MELCNKTNGETCLKCPDISLFETYGGCASCSRCVSCMCAEKKRLDAEPEISYNDSNSK